MLFATRAEKIADGVVHGIGIALGIAATATLVTIAWGSAEPGRIVCVMIYVSCLMAMLIASALYNMLSNGEKKGVLRRLDHAAIFLMIAGTYTPFSAMVIGGTTGRTLLIVVWAGALAGATIKLLALSVLERFTVPIYLALGWVVIFAYKPLLENASNVGFWFLMAGGLLYSAGTAFYAWKSLPYQTAIWHGFVLTAAICHFVAILTDVGLAAGIS